MFKRNYIQKFRMAKELIAVMLMYYRISGRRARVKISTAA